MEESLIVKNLKSGSYEHNKALGHLYESQVFKTPILTFLKLKGLDNNASLTLWTDIVVKFGLLVRKGKYQHQGKMLGYIKNLANYMLLNYFRDQKANRTIEIENTIIKEPAIEAVTMYHKELKSLFEEQLSLLGDMCKSILELWSQDYSMDEIMKINNIVSVEATRKRKHICFKKLLDNVSNNQALSDLLEEYKNH